MATYILKVDAHPAAEAFPSDPREWEGGQFFGPAPRALSDSNNQPPIPKENDRVHVWFNEKSGGGGYTGYGKVIYCTKFSGNRRPTFELRLTKAKLVSVPITADCFRKYENYSEAIFSLRRYRLRQLLWLDKGQAAEFERVLGAITAEDLGHPRA